MNLDNTVIARVFGQDITDIPVDLFIPPDALQVMLHHFEGPLDLLLYLIRKQNLDILDIPIAHITQQYLDYIGLMKQGGIDLAAEYLLMAALLIEIKSRLLLPRSDLHEEEEEDPRAELARRLLIYEQMKAAAEKLDTLPQSGRDFYPSQLPIEPLVQINLPDVSVYDLQFAWLNILSRAKQYSHHQIVQEPLSIREQMSTILRQLQQNNKQLFTALFDVTAGAPIVVATFIALLELVKDGLINIIQQDVFEPIYLSLSCENTNATE